MFSSFKDVKLRESLQNEGVEPLEERSFTIVYGQNLVEVSYLHLCAANSEIAEVSITLISLII